ncbi:MAG: DMT family transporter [Verrucomicrobia bacterium]|nr:MAG: DMT family transporter [Verrucomicrobiota bacterium]
MKEKSRVAFVALLTGAVGIAFAPIFVRLSEVGPGATAFYRVFFALPVLWLWRLRERAYPGAPRRPSVPAEYRQLAVAGLLFAGDLALWHWSIKLTSVANATLFANFAPIFVTLGARILFSEKITASFLVGMALALAGAALVVGNGLRLTAGHLAGDLAGLATALFYGGYMLGVKSLRRSFSTATIMAWSGLAACPALFLVALASGERLVPAHATGWSVLLALALVSQVGGQSLIAYAFAHLPASFSSLSLLLQPAVAAFLAWGILAEPLGLLQGFGGSVILCGIAIAGRAKR